MPAPHSRRVQNFSLCFKTDDSLRKGRAFKTRTWFKADFLYRDDVVRTKRVTGLLLCYRWCGCWHWLNPPAKFACIRTSSVYAMGQLCRICVIHQTDLHAVALPGNMAFATTASLGYRFATSFHSVIDKGTGFQRAVSFNVVISTQNKLCP
jgi:hypothetical protein